METPSGTITLLHSTGTHNNSPARESPTYCHGFHSFTYGVGGSSENVAGEIKTGPAEENGTVWEEESFDADSPNVWHTRTVVDLEDNGSPTFRCEWNSETRESGASKGTVCNLVWSERYSWFATT